VVGLYLNPPTRPSCCAWTRNPRPRPWNGRCRCGRPGRGARKRSHDYIRHGTATLFAALGIATGKVTGACCPRGSFTSVKDLIAAIEDFIDGWNDRCRPFTWAKTADE
jgi:hypothetical protein